MTIPEWLIPASGAPQEFYTDERCYISELLNCEQSPQVSVAQARVRPGVTTQRHRLEGVAETYVLKQGAGVMEVGDEQYKVKIGDTVVIPAGVAQRISNDGDVDLVFYCVCTPRFEPSCYVNLESDL